ncbi:Cleft lip and palate transmembrane protein 1, partial [Helicosporidium sp. ATCC 50920]
MPDNAVAANGDAAPAQNGRQRGGLLGTIVRMVMMWYMMRMFFGKSSAPKPGDGSAGPASLVPRLGRGTPVDVHVFLSTEPMWRLAAQASAPLWSATNLPLGSFAETGASLDFAVPESVRRNGTAWVHAVITRAGASPDPGSSFFDADEAFGASTSLVAYLPEKRADEGVSLLAGKEEKEERKREEERKRSDAVARGEEAGNVKPPLQIVSHLKPNITIALVSEFGPMAPHSIAPHYAGLVKTDPSSGTYAPLVYFHQFWLLREQMPVLNSSVTTATVHVEVVAMAPWKMALFSQMEQSLSVQKQWGAMREGEGDDIKRIFLEGNPIFLGLTMVVSMLHSVFDMLAFKNDIGFWKNNKSMKGLSARTILLNCFCQLVIFLYLLDNETSLVVLASAGIGTAIEFWKVTKAMDVSVRWPGQHSGARTLRSRFPRLVIQDRASYTASQTDKYDAEAMRYLSYALYPLVLGYAVYALVYETHKSWYSWVLNSLVGAVYTFGFILMCPQLYLNYKLKSVAHLPWRQMTYKFLNTIIDDLFAFVIKMPILHRLSVFRDDVVFL